MPQRDYIFSKEDEPHAARRAEILKKYPEIKNLMGYEWKTKYFSTGTVALQIFLAWYTQDWSWPSYFLVLYVVGATATHSLFLAIHELAHNLGAKTTWENRLIGIVANLPILIPYCVSFKPYHMEHHRYQGYEGVDSDVPTPFEGWLITAHSFGYVDRTCRKALFMFFQILAYALRPLFVKPFLVPMDRWLLLNLVACASFDLLIFATLGYKGLLYLFLSAFLAGSIHPTAGHFIAEHYVMEGTAETYSYYGILNMFAYNVGYHNEHHDFPSIPWSNLPKVRKIAPEFYDNLPQCPSWPGVILRYIFDDNITPYSRVKRANKLEEKQN